MQFIHKEKGNCAVLKINDFFSAESCYINLLYTGVWNNTNIAASLGEKSENQHIGVKGLYPLKYLQCHVVFS